MRLKSAQVDALKVSFMQLAIDVANAERELSAFRMLHEGFAILAVMPENDSLTRAGYRMRAEHYRLMQVPCAELLAKLKALQTHGQTRSEE